MLSSGGPTLKKRYHYGEVKREVRVKVRWLLIAGKFDLKFLCKLSLKTLQIVARKKAKILKIIIDPYEAFCYFVFSQHLGIAPKCYL